MRPIVNKTLDLRQCFTLKAGGQNIHVTHIYILLLLMFSVRRLPIAETFDHAIQFYQNLRKNRVRIVCYNV